MTEKEAIEIIKIEKQCVLKSIEGCDRKCADCDLVRPDQEIIAGYDTAIKALEEIQQYREIGTVEECRAAVERQKPVRVEHEGSLSEDGFCNYRMARCPKCGEWRRDRDRDDNIYCSKCGSKLDWSEEE